MAESLTTSRFIAEAGVDQSVEDEEHQLVTLRLGSQTFGLPILAVQDIVEPRRITSVPTAPREVSGVLNLRGRIVTVINLGIVLGHNENPKPLQPHENARKNSREGFKENGVDSYKTHGVTVFHGDDLYTFLVDAIGDVINVSSEDLEPVPANLMLKTRQVSLGVIKRASDLILILDPGAVIAAIEGQSEDMHSGESSDALPSSIKRWTQMLTKGLDKEGILV